MLKQTLLAFTVLGFAGTAAAADITNPFFLPQGGHLASVTAFDYDHGHVKADDFNARTYGKTLTEELAFGIVNNLAVIGSLEKDWSKVKYAGWGSEKDHNDLDWEAGLAWNILHCNTKLQVSSVYGQEAPGAGPEMGTYKYFDTQVKLGYQFKTFLPYVTFAVETPVGQKKGADKWGYSGKVGVYQGKCGVWGLDTALVWAFDRNADVKSRTLTAEAEASYYLTKNMTIGVYASYMLDGKAKYGTDLYDKSVGARLRLYF